MVNLLKTPLRVGGTLFAAVVFAAAQAAVARPGTVNYAEGRVTVDGQSVSAKTLGSTEVAPGQVLETRNGKAEMLLTPGVFLRLGDNSAVKMVSPSLTDTRVDLLSGRAMVEIDQIAKENILDVMDRGADVRLLKKGLYSFNADQPRVAVYDGKAEVRVQDQSTDVGKGKEVDLQPYGKLKAQKFDRNQVDDLYAWSKLRSQYMAEANASSAQTIVVSNPGWWGGTGWYWNPWYSTWAFVPGAGYFDSPFGFGFYSPAYWYYNPPIYTYYGGYYPGYRGRVGPGRVWTGAGRPAPGARTTTPPAAIGGSGVRFGSPAVTRPSAPAMRAPSMSPAMRAPAMRAPAVGGSGVRFGRR